MIEVIRSVQIYAENREPFHAHLSPLLQLLLEEPATETAEKLAILHLLNMIINVKPEVREETVQ